MVSGGPYFRNADVFKKDAFAVLKNKFRSRRAFDRYYDAIPDARSKNEFLRVCCSYRYLAKHGKWRVFVRGINKDIAYLDDSFKLVAIFSLIESLSDQEHQDFYEWLNAQERGDVFPIKSKKELHNLYAEYKAIFGATKKCVSFFGKLPPDQKQQLCQAISTRGTPMDNIKKLAQFLYNLRSKFVHEAEFVHELSTGHTLTDRGLVRSTLTVQAVFDAFEAGVIAHFSQ